MGRGVQRGGPLQRPAVGGRGGGGADGPLDHPPGRPGGAGGRQGGRNPGAPQGSPRADRLSMVNITLRSLAVSVRRVRDGGRT